MIRILLKSLILYFLFTAMLFSQIITQIEVIGNKRISKESVLVFSELNTGLEYNESLINNSLKIQSFHLLCLITNCNPTM